MSVPYYLYWIHLPTDTDILSEGYIGATNQPKRRLREHRSKNQNPKLVDFLAQQKDIVHTILLIGPEDYCYEMEAKLRPLPNIGLNQMPGGCKPPSHKGRKHPVVRAIMLSERNPMNNPTSRVKVGLSKKGTRQPWAAITGKANGGKVVCKDRTGTIFRVSQEEFDNRSDLVGLRSKII